MNLLVLYLLLLKATLTSVSGMGSLPMVRQDFVVTRHALTDHQLNTAVVAGRTGPGPYGIYLVCVAYAVAGTPGAVVGFLATITPAFLVIPLMSWVGAHANKPRVRAAVQALMLASAGLLLFASVPLARDAIVGPLTLVLAAISFVVISFTRAESMWVMFAAAAVGLAARMFVA
jgi:chromate transporter